MVAPVEFRRRNDMKTTPCPTDYSFIENLLGSEDTFVKRKDVEEAEGTFKSFQTHTQTQKSVEVIRKTGLSCSCLWKEVKYNFLTFAETGMLLT